MAHQVENMMYRGQVPWHGLGTYLDAPPTIEEGIRAAGLDWTVSLHPLLLKDGRTVEQKAVIRDSDHSILGVVGSHYRPLQNHESFAWFQPFLDAGEMELHTAGSLQNGRKVWILAKFRGPGMEIAEGDVVKKYLLLSNSHDGTNAVRIGFTPIRVVCANTLSLAHSDKVSQLLRCRHTRGIKVTLDLIREVVNVANEEFAATATQYKKLAQCPINRNDFRRYVRKVFGVAENEPVSTRQQRIFDSIERLFDIGRGSDLPSIRGTVWVAYNAVNEYLTYQRGRAGDNRLYSLWFGASAQIDRKALALALEYASAA